jgi:polysaccharide pyruvyl transferase WcaK-like protein
MSPDRLERHFQPDDNEVVLWGDFREVETALEGRRRHAVWLSWVAMSVTLATGLAVAYLTERADKVDRRQEQATCAIVRYADQQSLNIAKAAANLAPDSGMRLNLVSRARELQELANAARATGIDCPPSRNSLSP